MKTIFTALFAVFLSSGCATVSLHVSDAELAALSAEQRKTIQPTEEALENARAEVEQRRKEHSEAVRQDQIAEELIRKAESELRVAQLRFESAQETREADAMLPAKSERTRAERALERAHAEHGVREASENLAQARLEQAQAKVEAAAAALELARLNAMLAAREPLTPADAERRSNFEAQVASADTELAQSKQATAEAEAAVARAKAALGAAPETGVGKDAKTESGGEPDAGHAEATRGRSHRGASKK